MKQMRPQFVILQTEKEKELASFLNTTDEELWNNRETILSLWQQVEKEAEERTYSPFFWHTPFYFTIMESYGRYIPFTDLVQGDLERILRWPREAAKLVQEYNYGWSYLNWTTDDLYQAATPKKKTLLELI